MGKPSQPLPVKLVMPMFTGYPELFDQAQQALIAYFGPVDYASPVSPFDYTRYYAPEFGEGLLRQFISFEKLVDPGRLAEIKLLTNRLEQDLGQAGQRRINLDPGYIELSKLVLATTKNRSHRIYVGQGIYAEVTLTYCQKQFCPLPWTYPDYRTDAYREIMGTIRSIYAAQCKALGETLTPPSSSHPR